MSVEMTVTGNLGRDPELRYTKSGKAVCSLAIGAQASQKNRDTQQWEPIGEPVWIEASFWDQEAERLSQMLRKGDKVTVKGTLKVEAYQGNDGQQRTRMVAHYPRFLGVIPKQGAPAPQQSYAQGSYAQPTSDPWGTAGGAGDVAPF